MVSTRVFANAHRIAFYYANDGEPDTSAAIERAWRMGKSCYLPVVVHPNRPLRFARYVRGQRMRKNWFGIPEPLVPRHKLITANLLDAVLVPLVAFDAQGGRLGMGLGYYDRTLAFVADRRSWRSPKVVGAAYAFQQVERVPQERWDVDLHGVITEKGFLQV